MSLSGRCISYDDISAISIQYLPDLNINKNIEEETMWNEGTETERSTSPRHIRLATSRVIFISISRIHDGFGLAVSKEISFLLVNYETIR